MSQFFMQVDFFNFSSFKLKIKRSWTLYQANAAILTPFSKEVQILIKNLYERKGYNAWQFITEFPDKG